MSNKTSRIVFTSDYTQVVCCDEPGQGNACHQYQIESRPTDTNSIIHNINLTSVSFQNGPIKEYGVNGCQNEDLISIVIDRLKGFQSGTFACEENATALSKLEEALVSLQSRTNKRKARGVEGKNII